MSAGAGEHWPVELDAVLPRRLRDAEPGPLLAGRAATVRLDAGAAQTWTLELDHGRVAVRRGALPDPTTTIRATPATLAAVAQGWESGIGAFLAGTVTVRGDLALALQVDGLFDSPGRPERFPRARLVTAFGVPTCYLEAGPADAPPVVLLHGLGATNASMLPTLWDLARDHRVIAPDLPGFGGSGAPRGRYHAVWFARWLSAFQRAVGALPASLVGNSLGGRIAIAAGTRNPAEVEAMVLLCPSPAFRRMRQFVPAVRLLSPRLAGPLRLPLTHRAVVRAIRFMFARPERLADAWYDAAADEFLRVMRAPAARVAFFATARQIYLEQAYGERGFWDRLPRLRRPALFVWGERDRLVPASFARHVRAALPGAESVLLPDCGHVPQFEHPERTAELTRAFLDARRGS